MFEHVGPKNYGTFMQMVRKHLEPAGLFLLGTVGKNRSTWRNDPWLSRYIFPNSLLPSATWIGRAVEGLFVIEDWQSFGADYDRTLMAWYNNFQTNWNEVREKYGEPFSPHVGVLSLLLRGRLSRSTNSDVADSPFSQRDCRRLSSTSIMLVIHQRQRDRVRHVPWACRGRDIRPIGHGLRVERNSPTRQVSRGSLRNREADGQSQA
jgi:hypothetical protein